MKHGKTTAALTVAAATLLVSASAMQDQGMDKGKAEAGYEQMGDMIPGPGEEHARLEPLIGKWNLTVRMQMAPGEWTESTATAERKWVYGGRYLVEEVEGDMMGMPFQGMGLMGYDTVAKEYFSTWIDNFGTGLIVLRGQADASGKVITMEGMNSDAMTGQIDVWSRSVSRVVDDDTAVFEMYSRDEEGNVVKTLEIHNTRM